MKASCLVVRRAAPTADISGLSRRLEFHVQSCLACQAEMARYGKLRRNLAALADVVEEAPAPLIAAVEQAIGSDDASATAPDRHSHRVVAAAGAVVAAAAGAVAVAMWRHSRPVV